MRDIAEGALFWVTTAGIALMFAGAIYSAATATNNLAVILWTIWAIVVAAFLAAMFGFLGERIRRG